MTPDARRTEALKKAGLPRRTADNQGVISAKGGRAPQLISGLKQQLIPRLERPGAWQPTESEQVC